MPRDLSVRPNLPFDWTHAFFTAFGEPLYQCQRDYSFSTNINIPAILGTNCAYVGFTASDAASGTTSVQYISDFNYVSLLSASASVSGGNLVISWPGATGAYAVEQSPVLGPNAQWTAVSATPSAVGDQLQITIPSPSAPRFYRLILTNAPGNL